MLSTALHVLIWNVYVAAFPIGLGMPVMFGMFVRPPVTTIDVTRNKHLLQEILSPYEIAYDKPSFSRSNDLIPTYILGVDRLQSQPLGKRYLSV